MLSLAAPSSAQQATAPAAARRFGGACGPQSPAAPPHRSPAGTGASAAAAAGCSRQRLRTPRPRRPSGESKLLKAAAAGTARIVAVVDVHVGRHHRQGGDDRPRLCLAGDLDHLHREDDRADRHSAQAARRARQDRRCTVAGGSAVRARRQGQRAVVLACGGDARGAAVGRHFQRRRHQGTRRLELCRDRARRGAADPARHGPARHHRRDVALRRTVRHRLGHHEQLHRHLESRRPPTSPWSRPASPRRCSRPRSVWSRRSRPSSSTITSARVTKGYLELVSRASGAAGRLLSRDLDRTHVSGSHVRGAAE